MIEFNRNKIIKGLILLILFALIEVNGQSCNSSYGDGLLNPACRNKKNPYCVNSDPLSIIPNYVCAECSTNCDCKLNHYCSNAPGTAGKCMKFKKYGKKCFPLEYSQLINIDFPDDWKCAYVYTTNLGGLALDQEGVCIEGKCRTCDYDGGGSGLGTCDSFSGLQESRTCTYPGTQIDRYGAAWKNANYKNNPHAVWWAIFFFFILVVLAAQLITLKYKMAGKSPKVKKDKSVPQSEVELQQGTPPNQTEMGNNNSTVDPNNVNVNPNQRISYPTPSSPSPASSARNTMIQEDNGNYNNMSSEMMNRANESPRNSQNQPPYQPQPQYQSGQPYQPQPQYQSGGYQPQPQHQSGGYQPQPQHQSGNFQPPPNYYQTQPQQSTDAPEVDDNRNSVQPPYNTNPPEDYTNPPPQ